jgi:PAS domain S-box-containing protein
MNSPTMQFGQPLDALVQHWSELPSACCIVDNNGTFRWVNAAFTTLTADDPAAVLNMPMASLSECLAQIAEHCQSSAVSGRPARIQNLRMPHPGVTYRWATGMTFPVPGPGQIMGAGLFFDLGDHADIGAELHWLLARAPVFVLCTDTDLRYTWSSGGLISHVGMSEPGVGQTAYEILQTDDPTHPAIAPLLAALGGKEVSYRVQFNGQWFDNWVGPLTDSDGRIVGTLAAILDVTELEVARHQVELAEERFRRLVDQSPALIAIRDASRRVVHVNPAFLRTFGRTREQVEDQGVDDHVLRGGAADLAAIEEGVQSSGLPRVWQGQLPHPAGHEVDILGHVFPLPLDNDETGIGEVFLDMSEQARSRRALVDSEQRYRAIFNSAEICILLLDQFGNIADANPTYVRTTGQALRVVRGRDFNEIALAEDRDENQRLWNDLLAGRRTRYDLPVSLRHADGSVLPARLTVTLIRDQVKVVTGLVLAVPTSAQEKKVTVSTTTRAKPTAAEAAVLERLASGMTFQQIADDLKLTRRGVDYRVTKLRHKLRADGAQRVPATTAALIARAYALGIIQPGAWPPRIADDLTHHEP